MHSAPPQTAQSCIRPIPGRTESGALRLFCFPYAGAGASVFREWGKGLPEGVEAFAVQLPGREDRFFGQPPGSYSTRSVGSGGTNNGRSSRKVLYTTNVIEASTPGSGSRPPPRPLPD